MSIGMAPRAQDEGMGVLYHADSVYKLHGAEGFINRDATARVYKQPEHRSAAPAGAPRGFINVSCIL